MHKVTEFYGILDGFYLEFDLDIKTTNPTINTYNRKPILNFVSPPKTKNCLFLDSLCFYSFEGFNAS